MLKRVLGLLLASTMCLVAQTRYVKSFNSIADMVAANPNDVTTHCAVKYLSSSGSADSGGDFYYDANSVAATNTTTVFKPTNYGGRWIRSSDPSGTGGGSAVPTGTGLRHVTAGIEDAATKLIDTADINPNQVTYDRMQDVSASQRLIGRNSVGVGDPEEVTISQVLDWLNSNVGSILYRGAGGWSGLNAGTSGTFLMTQGGGLAPVWSSISGIASVNYVNGASVTLANFNNSTPSAPGTGVNVTWQVSSSTNVSAYVQAASDAQGGIITTAAQTLTGNKTFTNSFLSFGTSLGRKIVLYDATSPDYFGIGIDTSTVRLDVGNVSSGFAFGFGTGTNSTSTNFASLDAAGFRTSNGTFTNAPGPALYGNPSTGVDKLQAIAVGTGLGLSGGTLSVNGSTIASFTNNNRAAFNDLVIVSEEERGLSFVTTNTYSIDFNGTATYRIVATNNVILSFINVPTSTNTYVGPIYVSITNAVTVSTNTLSVNWPVANRDDWIEQQNPTILSGKVYELKFWWNGYEVKGSANGPRLQENEYATTTLTATSAVTNYVADFNTGTYAVIVAANDVFFLNSTNRVSTQYGSTKNKGIWIRASGANRRVDLNSSWKLSGTTTTPITVTNGTALKLSLEDYGPAETNVLAGAIYTQ